MVEAIAALACPFVVRGPVGRTGRLRDAADSLIAQPVNWTRITTVKRVLLDHV